MKTKQISHHGWQGLPLRAGALALVLASTLLVGCASPRESNSANVSPVAAQSMQTRQQIAKAMFAERCKTAGEKIHRTVENVEGVFLMKLPPDEINFGDQFRLDDPFIGRAGHVEFFLLNRTKSGSLVPEPSFSNGYRYVEIVDRKDAQRYRFVGSLEEPWQTNKAYLKGYTRFVLNKALTTSIKSRYGITYDDISTYEEREYWIAGSSLKVIDLQTNEIIAERIGYMVDWAQGSTGGGRSPWLMAYRNACPKFPTDTGGHPYTTNQVRDFVEKVLQIKQGE